MTVSRSNSRIKTGISIPLRTRPAPGDLGTRLNPQRSPFCREAALVIRTRPRSEPERLRARRFPAERPAWPSGAVGRPLVAARWRGSSLRASVPHLAKYSPHRGLQDIRHLPRRRDAPVPRAKHPLPHRPPSSSRLLCTLRPRSAEMARLGQGKWDMDPLAVATGRNLLVGFEPSPNASGPVSRTSPLTRSLQTRSGSKLNSEPRGSRYVSSGSCPWFEHSFFSLT